MRYRCSACGLAAHSCGGLALDFRSVTVTVWCPICQHLHDSRLYGRPAAWWKEHEQEAAAVEARAQCVRAADHPVLPWHHGDPCPRCGAALSRIGPVLSWELGGEPVEAR